jgi:hypothetical protein
MARDPIIADSARITPRKVFGEEITILADHTQTGSYEIYVHDAPEGVGPPLTLTHGRKPSTSSKARWILFAAMWQRLFNRAGLCMFRPERFIRSDTPAPRAYWASLRATEQLRCSLLLTESAGIHRDEALSRWFVTGFENVRERLRNKDLSNDINKALPNSYAGRIAANAKESGMSITIGSMIFMDDR